MSLLRHIQACNSYRPERFLPLFLGDERVGLVRRDNAEVLRRFPRAIEVGSDSLRIVPRKDGAAITAALDEVVEVLVADGLIAKWRDEVFAITPRWGEAPLFTLDRGAVSFFGVRAYGVHMNGYRRIRDRTWLWIGRRNPLKLVAPGKLDNLVAGGIGGGLGALQTLVKEAGEEASIPAAIIAQARAASAITYKMEVPQGLRDDVLFVYDLVVPDDFEPQNTDGEIVEFMLMEAREVLARVRDTDDFKFNVSLILIDFALRHGLVTPEDPDYLALVAGLRAGGA
jgi:8-oxo-dGTP pyrophosphatase MutT (NUDIX family)